MSDAADTRKYFTGAAVTFDSLYSESSMSPIMRIINRRFRRDIYERYVRTMRHIEVQGASSVLDVGCGSGRYALGMREAGVKRVVGVDFSPTMIELAETAISHIPNRGEMFEFRQCDIMELTTDETFDVVVAMGFFDYVNDPVHVLRRLRQLAKRSVIASFPSVSFYRTPIRKIRYFIKHCPVYFYHTKMIHAFSEEAGFANCEVSKIRGSGMDYFVTFEK